MGTQLPEVTVILSDDLVFLEDRFANQEVDSIIHRVHRAWALSETRLAGNQEGFLSRVNNI
jgi:hypothetical protein